MRPGDRQTGRTTRMVAEAIDAAVAGERVVIVAADPHIAKFVVRPIVERLWAERSFTGQPPFVITDVGGERRATEGTLSRIFYDHTVAERRR